MVQELRQARDFGFCRGEAAVEIALEHHPKIERAPTRHARTHHLFPLVEVVPGVLDLLT